MTAFERADSTRAIAAAAIYYNDLEGIRAMTGALTLERGWPVLRPLFPSLIQTALKDQTGRFLPGLAVGDRWFVVGEEGRRYSILLRNKLISGWKRSYQWTGSTCWMAGPLHYTSVGTFFLLMVSWSWRVSAKATGAVAAFRFSSVRESYANEKCHQTRNVGVIGVAIFNERGTTPYSGREVQKRLRANPFAGFATPP